MNKKLFMIISLGCMIGAQVCAMEEPLSSEEQIKILDTEIANAEDAMNASKSGLDQITQAFVQKAQVVQAGQKDYQTMVQLKALINLKKQKQTEYEDSKRHYEELLQQKNDLMIAQFPEQEQKEL